MALAQQEIIASVKARMGQFRRDVVGSFVGVRKDIDRINRDIASKQLAIVKTTSAAEKRAIRSTIAELRRKNVVLRQINASAKSFLTTMTRASLIIGITVALIGSQLLRAMGRAAKLGIDLNTEFEAMQVGVAATLAANTQVVDSMGKQLKGAKAIIGAQTLALDIQERIFEVALATGGTVEDTLGAFRIGLPLILQDIKQAGRDANEALNETLDVVKGLSLAAIAIGIPAELVRLQIDDILKGVVTTRTLLARVLGIQQEQLRVAKEQGKIVTFTLDKLKAFFDAQEQLLGKFAAIKQRLVAIGQIILTQVTKGGFLLLKVILSDILASIVIFDEKTKAIKGFRPEIIEQIELMRDAFSDFLVTVVVSTPIILRFLLEIVFMFGRLVAGIDLVIGGFLNLTSIGQQFRAEELAQQAGKRLETAKRIRRGESNIFDLLSFGFDVDKPEGREKIAANLEQLAIENQKTAARMLESATQNALFAETAKEFAASIRDLRAGTTTILGTVQDAISGALPAIRELRELLRGGAAPSGISLRLPPSTAPDIRTAGASLFALQSRLRTAQTAEKSISLQKDIRDLLGEFEGEDVKAVKEVAKFFTKMAKDLEKAAKEAGKLAANIRKAAIKDIEEQIEKRISNIRRLGKLQEQIIKLTAASEKQAITEIFNLRAQMIEDTAQSEQELKDQLFENEIQRTIALAQEQKARFESLISDIKSSAGRVFDAMLEKGKSVFRSLAEFATGIFTTLLRTIFINVVEGIAKGVLTTLGKVLRKGKKGGILDKLADLLGLPDPRIQKELKEAQIALKNATNENTKAIIDLTQALRALSIPAGGGAGGGGGLGTLGGLGGIVGTVGQFLPGRAGAAAGTVGGLFGGGGKGNIFGGGRGGGGIGGIGNILGTAGQAALGFVGAGVSAGIAAGTGAAAGATGALTALASAAPILAPLIGGLIAFQILSTGAERREARRVKTVQRAFESGQFTPTERMNFLFANQATVGGTLGSEFVEGQGGMFFETPRGGGAGVTVNINALDAKSFADRKDELFEVFEPLVQTRLSQAPVRSNNMRTSMIRALDPA